MLWIRKVWRMGGYVSKKRSLASFWVMDDLIVGVLIFVGNVGGRLKICFSKCYDYGRGTIQCIPSTYRGCMKSGKFGDFCFISGSAICRNR